jgi:hypothetical protein
MLMLLKQRVVLGGLFILVGAWFCPSLVEANNSKAKEAIAAAVEAMGGERYSAVKTIQTTGRYFVFKNSRTRGFAQYRDYTVLDPVKWRFELGPPKRHDVTIYNLELGQGWKYDGRETIEPASEQEIDDFRRAAKLDVDLLLRQRVDEEGVSLFYYGPGDIAGTGEFEAVEFLDSKNDSAVVFFDRRTRLPTKVETQVVDRLGIRRKQEVEYFNWHVIEGVRFPLRVDVTVDGELSQQRHIEKVSFNQTLPDAFFLEPKIEKKK